MPKQQKRLGRGLDALISSTRDSAGAAALSPPPAGPQAPPATIEVDRIRPNPFQPRSEMASADLQTLAESIRKTGLIQPVIVRRREEDVYELISGERRWRAAQIAGMTRIPVVVRDATDEQMLEMALVENIFREDLNAIDRAMAYRRYCDEFELSADEVAARLGEDRSTVANYLRLLDLPEEVKQWVIEGKLAMGHARCLLALNSPSERVQVAKHAIERSLSVRALEKLVSERAAARGSASRATAGRGEDKRPQIRRLEELFIHELGTKVEIHEARRRGTGRIVIHYYSLDDFDRVADRLGVDLNQ